MAIIVPNTASSFTAGGCVVGSENVWVWLTFVTPITSSGSVYFFRSSTSQAGRELLPIVKGACEVAPMFGPFNSPCGIYCASISGGSAIVWMKLTQ